MASKISIKDVKALASVLPTVLNPGLGAMVKVATQAVKKGGTQPTTTTTNTNNNKKKKDDDPVGVSYDPAQLGPKNMRVGRLNKGGLVSYKSVTDMER
jgi:hypothetical protein